MYGASLAVVHRGKVARGVLPPDQACTYWFTGGSVAPPSMYVLWLDVGLHIIFEWYPLIKLEHTDTHPLPPLPTPQQSHAAGWAALWWRPCLNSTLTTDRATNTQKRWRSQCVVATSFIVTTTIRSYQWMSTNHGNHEPERIAQEPAKIDRNTLVYDKSAQKHCSQSWPTSCFFKDHD